MSENKKIFVCHGKACSEKFSKYILSRLEADADFYQYKNCSFGKIFCLGKCETAPNIKIDSEILEAQNPVKSSKILHDIMMENT